MTESTTDRVRRLAREESDRNRAAISGMDPMEKRALIAACILVAVLVSLAVLVVRWVF